MRLQKLKLSQISTLCLALSLIPAYASNWDAHWSFDGHGQDEKETHHGSFPLSGVGSFDMGRKDRSLYYDLLRVDTLSIQRATEPFSIALWAIRENTHFPETLVSKQAGPAAAGLSIELDAGNNLVVNLKDKQGGKLQVRANVSWIDLSDWHHLVVSYDGSVQASGIKVYFDGELVPAQIIHDDLTDNISSAAPFVIGAAESDSYAVFNGAIDEVYLASWELNSADVDCLTALRDSCVVSGIEQLPEIGEPGPRGFEGPAGPQGLQGARGPRGAAGITGPEGDQGPTGSSGVKGNKGPRGDKGSTGLAGQPGIDGRAGRDGKDGNPGISGPQGPDGAKGPKGVRGPAGLVGSVGDTGMQGLKGATGPKGDRGAVGPVGRKGDTGLTGAAGADGVQGPKGDKGPVGVAGVQGAEGPRGPEGAAGATGPNGLPPASRRGPTGPQGDRGPQGPRGPDVIVRGTGGVNPRSIVQEYQLMKQREMQMAMEQTPALSTNKDTN